MCVYQRYGFESLLGNNKTKKNVTLTVGLNGQRFM
jgi:hypothetical protein